MNALYLLAVGEALLLVYCLLLSNRISKMNK
ncbi:hypothetical protein HWC29_gp064 [Aeromonas phage 4_4572]|uniref:Uncharacterized protein n=1 Tax=Aeromonas phage 4_4572 TaxID=2588517 RepID=A0A5B9N9H3_9CAUD|nr:hypothetical protein HWC29_gp064 [Aeromonas phage 4_4572]QEG09122.1 hypothetical protein [Aeromonas phage 4_4572]